MTKFVVLMKKGGIPRSTMYSQPPYALAVLANSLDKCTNSDTPKLRLPACDLFIKRTTSMTYPVTRAQGVLTVHANPHAEGRLLLRVSSRNHAP